MPLESDGANGPLDTAAIIDLIDDLPVTLVVLYGSHAREEETEESDIDLAIAYRDTVPEIERTRARFALIDRLSTRLDTAVDVVPLSETVGSLRRAICEEGVVVYGEPAEFDAFCTDGSVPTTHDERLAAFDDVVATLKRVV